MSTCTACNSADIAHLVDTDMILYKGTQLESLVQYSLCNSCGREYLSKEDILASEQYAREAKSKSDNLLLPAQVKELRSRLGITQTQAAQLFGGGSNAFSKYERGEVNQSLSMDRLMKLAFKYSIVLDELASIAGIELPKTDHGYGKSETFRQLRRTKPRLKLVSSNQIIKAESYEEIANC